MQNILSRKTITPPQPARHAAPIRKNFCRKSKAAHEFTRQFAPLRATLIPSARPDRISTGYRAGHQMNSCSPLRHAVPVRRPPRRRRRPSPSLPSPLIHREFSCPISPNLSHARSCLSTHPTAQKILRSESHLKQRLFGRKSQLNRGRLACPYAIRNAPYATQQKAGSRCGRTLDAYALAHRRPPLEKDAIRATMSASSSPICPP